MLWMQLRFQIGSEKEVGEPKAQDIEHRLLAHVVVDPVDPRFVEGLVQNRVQLACRGQVAAERLFDHHTGVIGTAGLGQVLRDCSEKTGRNRQVVQRTFCGAQRLP